jgi:cell shape-determining protein MreC
MYAICVCFGIVVSNTYCVVFLLCFVFLLLVYPMLHVSLNCPFQIALYVNKVTNVITGFVTRLTRRVSLVEQDLLTLPEHLSSPPFLVGFVLLDI